MKTFLKSISHLIIPLIVVMMLSSVTLAFAQSSKEYVEQPVFELYGLKDEIKEVGPGDTVSVSPFCLNAGSMDIYICIAIEQQIVNNPKFKDGYTDYYIPDTSSAPVYTYNINEGWILVEEKIRDTSVEDIYIYSSPLKPGEKTPPLFEYAVMQDFTNPCFGLYVDDPNITVNAIAVPAGSNNLSPSAIWNSMKSYMLNY